MEDIKSNEELNESLIAADENCTHVVEDDNEDIALCGVDVSGEPWDNDFELGLPCSDCIEEDERRRLEWLRNGLGNL